MKKTLLLSLVLFCLASCRIKPIEVNAVVTNINPPVQVTAGEPHLFTAANDSVLLSWIEKKGDTSSLLFSTFLGASWSTPRLIARDTNWFVNWADYPMIAQNQKGMMAHFLQKSGDGTFAYDVKITRSADGGVTWSIPQSLNEDGKEAEHGFVSILPYGEKFLLTWLDGRNTVMEGMEGMDHHDGHHGEMSLRAAIINADGQKENEWQLDSRTCDCCQTSAALTDNGPIIIYRDRSRDEIRDMSIVRWVDGTWTEPKTIYADDWKIEGCPVNGPRMEAVGNNVAIAWYSIPAGKPEVKVIFSTDGGETFGKPIQVDEGGSIGRVDLVMLADKSAVVSWMEGAVIKAIQVYPDGTRSSTVEVGSSSEARSSGFPQMTKSGSDLLFAWTNDQTKLIEAVKVELPFN